MKGDLVYWKQLDKYIKCDKNKKLIISKKYFPLRFGGVEVESSEITQLKYLKIQWVQREIRLAQEVSEQMVLWVSGGRGAVFTTPGVSRELVNSTWILSMLTPCLKHDIM